MKNSVLRALFHTQLSQLYEEREIDAIFFTYIDDKYNIKKHSYYLNPNFQITFEKPDLKALAKGTPIQYVTEKTIFCDLQLTVNPSVLIPRPETAEFAAFIIREIRQRS